MEDAGMLADVKAYDAAKARLENGEDELIPLEITERRARGEPAPAGDAGIASSTRGKSQEEGKAGIWQLSTGRNAPPLKAFLGD
jgi:hypothetical protein